MSDLEGVAVNQLINVAIAETLAQMRTAKWLADRIAAANPKNGAQLIRALSDGGREKPHTIAPATKKARRGPTAV